MISSRERFIYILKIVILISIILWFLFGKNETYVSEYQNQINALNSKIDSLHSINDNLGSKIDTLNNQITSLDSEINNQDNLIKKLKIKTNEKVRAVDNFNDDELYQFFAERYRQHFDSIRKAGSEVSN
jgi:cell division protein FtsL